MGIVYKLEKPHIKKIADQWTTVEYMPFRPIAAPTLQLLKDRWHERVPRSIFDRHGDW